MNRIDLELKIKETDPSTFQRMCDYLLEKRLQSYTFRKL